MTLKLYFDEQVPRAIAIGARGRGLDILTIQDDNRLGAKDHEVLARAGELGRALVTMDRDFLIIAGELQ